MQKTLTVTAPVTVTFRPMIGEKEYIRQFVTLDDMTAAERRRMAQTWHSAQQALLDALETHPELANAYFAHLAAQEIGLEADDEAQALEPLIRTLPPKVQAHFLPGLGFDADFIEKIGDFLDVVQITIGRPQVLV